MSSSAYNQLVASHRLDRGTQPSWPPPPSESLAPQLPGPPSPPSPSSLSFNHLAVLWFLEGALFDLVTGPVAPVGFCHLEYAPPPPPTHTFANFSISFSSQLEWEAFPARLGHSAWSSLACNYMRVSVISGHVSASPQVRRQHKGRAPALSPAVCTAWAHARSLGACVEGRNEQRCPALCKK